MIVVATSALKMLLLQSYRSTDFEVHRNWLSITYSLPLKAWYFEDTSEWTLDYPPLFAYFEWLLSQIAVLFDPQMVQISEKPYASNATVVFQRLSVIVTDLVLAGAVWRFVHSTRTIPPTTDITNTNTISKTATNPYSTAATTLRMTVFCITVLNAGLLLVDHIHFQYNGMLLGLLVLCFDLANRK